MREEDNDVGDQGGSVRRAHQNATERQRGDSIEDRFAALQEAVPPLRGRNVSPPVILEASASYILSMERRVTVQQHQVEDLRRQNRLLEERVRELEAVAASAAGDRFNHNAERGWASDSGSDSEVSCDSGGSLSSVEEG
ncbi:protein max-like [Haemaphysalis longicornis]